ncbi:MAG: GNAT family N-acetyltransferase [Anaerolineae bacterium]
MRAGIEIDEIGPDRLGDYAEVSAAFKVTSVLEIELVDQGLGGILLWEHVAPPYEKDYDALDGGPVTWAETFDVRNWGFLLASDGNRPVGGAVIAYRTPEVRMLEERDDLGVLWDLRVAPDDRGEGVGHALFWAAAHWCEARGCRQMKIETQNTNVPACRFYRRQGCELGQIHRYAYDRDSDVADEVMLIWYLAL